MCFFSNLITIPVQWCGYWIGVVGNIYFFNWFPGRNLLVDDQKFERGGDVKNMVNQISSGKPFFLFYQLKLMSHFVRVIPASPETTLTEQYLG